jgi:hypothetical protein
MDSIFLFKLFLSFIVGGLYIALTIRISERIGSRIGGLLIGLPSTLLVSLIFIAWTQDSRAAVSAIPVVPATIGVSSMFIVAFIHLYKYGKITAFIAASILWLILTLPLAILSFQSLTVSLILASVFFGITIYGLRRFPHRKLEHLALNRKEFFFRTIFAGSFIVIAVFLGKVSGPLWGGIFACFPAAFSSSLLILGNRHGIEFTSSVAKMMPLGSIGNVFFAVAFYFMVPFIGMLPGTVIAYLVSLALALSLGKIVR